MKALEKPITQASEKQSKEIDPDPDTGLTVAELRVELSKGAKSGVAEGSIEEIISGVQKRGRERVKLP